MKTLSIAIILIGTMISQPAAAWKDKSKMTNDDRTNARQEERSCLADCAERLNVAEAKCNFVFGDGDHEASRARCLNYMSVEVGRCNRKCE